MSYQPYRTENVAGDWGSDIDQFPDTDQTQDRRRDPGMPQQQSMGYPTQQQQPFQQPMGQQQRSFQEPTGRHQRAFQQPSGQFTQQHRAFQQPDYEGTGQLPPPVHPSTRQGQGFDGGERAPPSATWSTQAVAGTDSGATPPMYDRTGRSSWDRATQEWRGEVPQAGGRGVASNMQDRPGAATGQYGQQERFDTTQKTPSVGQKLKGGVEKLVDRVEGRHH